MEKDVKETRSVICRVIKEEDAYVLEDCNGNEICRTVETGESDIGKGLGEIRKNYESNQCRRWRLRIKEKNVIKEDLNPSTSFHSEIRKHIKDLLYINGPKQDDIDQNLWEKTDEVVFQEIFIDESINKGKDVKESSVICSVIKPKDKDEYILKDCNGIEICKTVKVRNSLKLYYMKKNKNQEIDLVDLSADRKKIIGQLLEKICMRYERKKYRVWRLQIKENNENKYINIASCQNTSFYGEICKHIKQLLYIINDKTQAKTYQKLWKRTEEVVLEEILVDKSIDEWIKKEKMDPYLKSLIAPEENQKPKEEPMKDMFDKLRAHYVEGRLAWEYGMKEDKKRAEELGEQYDGGIWNPGTGIDKEVYMYYKKQEGDTNE